MYLVMPRPASLTHLEKLDGSGSKGR